MMTNELREKIEKDLYKGMSLAASVYQTTMLSVVEKYMDETDDDGYTFMKEITMLTSDMFEKAIDNEYDKLFESKEES